MRNIKCVYFLVQLVNVSLLTYCNDSSRKGRVSETHVLQCTFLENFCVPQPLTLFLKEFPFDMRVCSISI